MGKGRKPALTLPFSKLMRENILILSFTPFWGGGKKKREQKTSAQRKKEWRQKGKKT